MTKPQRGEKHSDAQWISVNQLLKNSDYGPQLSLVVLLIRTYTLVGTFKIVLSTVRDGWDIESGKAEGEPQVLYLDLAMVPTRCRYDGLVALLCFLPRLKKQFSRDMLRFCLADTARATFTTSPMVFQTFHLLVSYWNGFSKKQLAASCPLGAILKSRIWWAGTPT